MTTTTESKNNNDESSIELSVVIPCLNEADTLEICIEKAQRAMRDHGITGEVIVADNGSTDGSLEIAEKMNARIIAVQAKGYGAALQGGIEGSAGKFVIMGDADDSYDFLEVPKFVDKLRDGYDLVMGCRLPGGGGTVAPGAMPFLHRWWGNPMFTFMARKMFKMPTHDVYCGLRGFTRELYDRLKLTCTGMEFATEMLIKSSLTGEKIAEVPITLHPDGRKNRAPHLKTFSDGWRTLRFFMMYSPRWLFLMPGLFLVFLGLIGYGLAMPGVAIFGAVLDAHTLLFASLSIIIGYQSMSFAVLAKIFSIREKFIPEDKRINRFFEIFTLEKGITVGACVSLCGIVTLGTAVVHWWQTGFAGLDYAETMRIVIPGFTLTILGYQSVMGSFFASILGMPRK
ncbi:Glycosyltransferase involved in cell wall bisynthesis [Candidatus Electrothrix marina]|uniref:Glycosyltransferase involved in cell wall bisynthesis n=1 Tax=Candidatus Electrothrix marina TaxID=1859130 RepID=A0A444JG38_9BACT|nr:Glycosyltransferase involved in cell wall bisynthesis [Candidatus Electrothrix marina]